MAKKQTQKTSPRPTKTNNTRQPTTTLAVGMQGVGKSYTSDRLYKKYVRLTGRPVLIIDITGEYGQYMAVKYDITETDQAKRCRNLTRINSNKPKIYRVLCRFPDGATPFDEEEIAILMQDIAAVLRNAMLVAEEMNSIFRRGIPKWFYKWITRLRHYSIDFVMHFQRIGDPHPDIYGNIKNMRIHKTEDSVTLPSTSKKVPAYELLRIAEIVVENRYTQGDKYFFCYVDIPNRKLLGVTRADFEKAVWKYLSENEREVNLLFREEDLEGRKRFGSKVEARRALVGQKLIQYL